MVEKISPRMGLKLWTARSALNPLSYQDSYIHVGRMIDEQTRQIERQTETKNESFRAPDKRGY